MCKLHYLQFEFQKQSSSRSQIFFGITVLKNLALFTGKNMCWNLNLIKLQASRPAILLEMNSNIGVFCEIYETFKNTFFDESCGSFWKYLVKHRFVAYENDEWCHFIIRIGSLVLISIYCVGFVSFYLFLFSYI